MANIITRAGKGASLSWNEADANFTNLNNDKIEAASPSTLTNKTVNLTSNTLTGTKAQFDTACSDDNFAYVGQANTFTQTQTISSGNLNLTGTAQRITGDFSNATTSNRVMFQTSTVNGETNVGAVPNGSSQFSRFTAFGASDPVNASLTQIYTDQLNGFSVLRAGANGSGLNLPLSLNVGGSERMRIDTNGYVGIGQSPARKLDVAGGARFIQDTAATTGAIVIRQSAGDTVGGFIQWVNNVDSAEKGWICMDTTSNLIFGPNSSEKFRFGSSGQLGIGGANYGTAGQVLTSNGSGSAPSWSNADSGLGVGQTWQNMTSSRVLGNTYTNNTGKPIYISVTTNSTVSAGVNIVVGGVLASQGSGWPSSGGQAYASAIIPAGASYSASVSSGTGTILNWAELR